MARIYQAQGRRSAVRKASAEALAIAIAEYGENHLMIARFHLAYGRVLGASSKWSQALDEYQSAQKLSQSLHVTHPQHLQILLEIARVHRLLGKKQLAKEALDQEALDRASELVVNLSPPSKSLVDRLADERQALHPQSASLRTTR